MKTQSAPRPKSLGIFDIEAKSTSCSRCRLEHFAPHGCSVNNPKDKQCWRAKARCRPHEQGKPSPVVQSGVAFASASRSTRRSRFRSAMQRIGHHSPRACRIQAATLAGHCADYVLASTNTWILTACSRPHPFGNRLVGQTLSRLWRQYRH
jgi:hypothetical protein